MKIHPRTLILISFLALNAAMIWRISAEEPAKQQPMDFDAAVKLLRDNKPVPPSLLVSAPTDPEQKKISEAAHKLANEEMTAIDVIHKAHRKVDLQILLPYVGFNSNPWQDLALYAGSPMRSPTTPAGMEMVWREQEMSRRSVWPMFAVILDLPDAPIALESYAVDAKNPASYRLEAFQVLAHLDRARSKPVAAKLKAEFAKASSPHGADIEKFIDSVQNGTEDFSGGDDIARLPVNSETIPL